MQGYGSTNDGNCAWKFFEDPALTSEITGIKENLTKRFKIILQVLVSGEEIDGDKYEAYARVTAEMYVNMYGWCNMTPTVHKLLIHGADIIRKALVPIGHLSEEALEARNKEFRKFRSKKSRRRSRLACNEDILHGLLVSSDPYISMLRYKISDQKKRRPLDPEAEALLCSSRPTHNDSGLGSDHESSDDESSENSEDVSDE